MEELNEIKNQFNELMAKAEEIVKKYGGKPEGKRWRADGGEGYYYVQYNDLHGFEAGLETEVGADEDEIAWKNRNYFRTQEEAEAVAQHFNDYLILKGDTKGFRPDFSSEEEWKWIVCYNADDGILESGCSRRRSTTPVHFQSEADAAASIEKHGDIWKRYLGVKEC